MTGVLMELIATGCAGLFAGAAIYITLVEHPARMSCGPRLAVTEFGPSYRRAAAMQAALASVGTIAALARWVGEGGAPWLAGALLLGLVVPFTLIVILPTNKRLLDPALEAESREAATLLRRWGRLHAVRAVSSLAAFAAFLLGLARG